MRSIKVTCCSCFFDRCVWLLTRADHDIKFEEIKLNKSDLLKIKDIIANCVFGLLYQFSYHNNLLNRAVFQSNVTDHFFRQPKHKSCFTSIQVCRYCYFCTNCKEL